MAQSHSTSISWALAFPNSHMVPLSISSNPDHQHRSQNAFTSASGARQLHRSFSIILPRVSSSCLFPFFQSLSKLSKRVLFVEYPSFGDKRIQRILLSGYRLRGRYQWVLLQSSIWRPIPSRIPRTEEDNVVASFSRSILPTTTLPTYPLPAASSSLTTIHNIDSNGSGSSNPFLRLFWNPNLLSASSELENGNLLSGGGYNYQRHQSQTFTFGGTHCWSTTSGDRVSFVFISWFAEEDAPGHHRQSSSGYHITTVALH